MIKEIYFKRYFKVLIAAILLILGLYGLNAFSNVSNWTKTKHYYETNSEVRQEFKKHPENFSYWDEDKEKEVPYQSFDDYKKANLYVYHTNWHSASVVKAQDYDAKQVYSSRFSDYAVPMVMVLTALAGFLVFFIDTKSNFLAFLFALPVSRKELFGKKLVYLALPLLGAVFLGQMLYISWLYLGIPQPYMNATFSQLLTSVLNSFALHVTLFSLSAFVGSMVGNLVFGPLTWFVFTIFLFFVPSTFTNLLSIPQLYDLFGQNTATASLFTYQLGKTGGHFAVSLILLILSAGFLYWAYRKFQTISLEHDGDFLLNPESRWPIWLFMTGFTSFVMLFNFVNVWQNYLASRHTEWQISLSVPIIATIITLLLCGGVSFILVFFSSIKSWFRSRKELRLAKS